MKKIALYTLLSFMAIPFVACSDEEEIPTPSGANDDFFSVPADATDPESVLRREFHKETGIHLLFSDVLRSTVVGKDADGNDIIKNETIDFAWNLTSYDDYLFYDIVPITDIDDQRKAVNLFKDNVMPHIQGSSMLPYSVMIVDDLQTREYEDDPGEYAVTMSCWRCLAVNAGGWIYAETPEEIAEHTATICKNLVTTKFSNRSDAAKKWMLISDEYYWEYIVDYIEDWDRDITKIYELGFLDYYEDWRGRPNRDEFPSSYNDFDTYFIYMFRMSKEEFTSKYGEYPIIMQKYNAMREAIEATGYKF